ncbi:MAG TPA: FAD-dependent oxidoreductase [Solirubrobacterales bacterium]
MELPEETEIAIVGAGVIGLSAAAFLAQSGHQVVVLDEASAPARGASAHNAGQIRPTACVPLAAPGALGELVRSSFRRGRPIRLGRGALRDWRWSSAFASWARGPGIDRRTRVLAELGQAGEDAFQTVEGWAGRELIHRCGSLDVFETEHEFGRAGELISVLRGHGFAAEPLSGKEVQEREPSLASAPAGGVWLPGAAHCDPVSVTSALASIAAAAGTRIATGAQVEEIELGPGAASLSSGGRTLRAETVVLAGGATASVRLPGALARCLPLLGGRGFGLDIDGGPRLRQSLILTERHVSATPWPHGGLRLTTGMDVGATGTRIAERRLRALRASAAAMFGDLGPDSGRPWVGVRPLTPDGLPLIGRLTGCPRALVASGHGMLGVTYGPATGRLVAELIDGGAPGWASDFSPERFASGWSPRKAAGSVSR